MTSNQQTMAGNQPTQPTMVPTYVQLTKARDLNADRAKTRRQRITVFLRCRERNQA